METSTSTMDSSDRPADEATQPEPVDHRRSGRLERPQRDRVLAGVAAALGHRIGVNPWWVRAAFVLISMTGGLGILLYVAGWVLIPSEGEENPPAVKAAHGLGGTQSWVGVVLVAIAAIWVIGQLDVVRPGLVWAVVLMVLGVLLYRGDLRRLDDAPRPEEALAPGEAPSTPTITPPPSSGAPSSTADRFSTVPSVPARRREREPRSMLLRLTMAVGLIGVGLVAALDTAGVAFPEPRHYLALGLGVTGLGLLVGAWYGRSRLLMVLGVLLVPLLAISTVIDVPLRGGFGERYYWAGSPAEVAGAYRLAAGSLFLDFGDLRPGDEPIEVAATVGVGSITVVLPDPTGARVSAHTGLGEITTRNDFERGVNASLEDTWEGRRGTIVLDLDVGLGNVHVWQRTPVDVETESIDPATGLPLDPATGLPLDPQSPLPERSS